jgi:hypothetical protein
MADKPEESCQTSQTAPMFTAMFSKKASAPEVALLANLSRLHKKPPPQ